MGGTLPDDDVNLRMTWQGDKLAQKFMSESSKRKEALAEMEKLAAGGLRGWGLSNKNVVNFIALFVRRRWGRVEGARGQACFD